MPLTLDQKERKLAWRTSRLLLYSLIVVLGILALFDRLPLPEILAGFGWLLLLAALWIVVYHVIEAVRRL